MERKEALVNENGVLKPLSETDSALLAKLPGAETDVIRLPDRQEPKQVEHVRLSEYIEY